MTKVNTSNGNETKSDIFPWDVFKSDTIYFFYRNILEYFHDFQNQNFSLLWLKWTQTRGMKQNHTFFHQTYSNLVPYLFVSKHIKVFQWLSKSKFLSFMTKVNPNNESETKSDIFSWYIFKSDTISFLSKYIKVF